MAIGHVITVWITILSSSIKFVNEYFSQFRGFCLVFLYPNQQFPQEVNEISGKTGVAKVTPVFLWLKAGYGFSHISEVGLNRDVLFPTAGLFQVAVVFL